MKSYFIYSSKIGEIYIAGEKDFITDVGFGSIDHKINETEIIHKTYIQLDEYFNGKRKSFDIPLRIEGTPFQEAVWHVLLTIPYGETRSYKDTAEQIGRPNACRAVGNANNKNKISIIIPCHRVIGANGSLAGYGGGLEIKKKLLEIERKYQNSR